MKPEKMRCNDISYRQGYIEVVPGIHPNHINIEVWNVHPDVDISDKAFDDGRISDEAIIANTEIELSAQQARRLIASLEAALAKMEKDA